MTKREAKQRAYNLAAWVVGEYVKRAQVYKDLSDEYPHDCARINDALDAISQALYRRGD